MSLYAVVDTNVLISALLAKKSDAATVKVLEADIIFWQVVMAERQNGAFLITGNIKHFPKRNFVVTPAQMAEMFDW